MASDAAGADLGCLVCFSALTTFCDTKTYGAKGCCGNTNAGCCGSCCNSSFDEDAFDVQAQKDRKEAEGTDAQPAPQVQMSAIKLKPQPEDAGSLIIAKAEDT